MISNKWIKVTALAIGYPSLILSTAILFHWLINENILSRLVGLSLFFLFVILNILLIVIYSYKKNV